MVKVYNENETSLKPIIIIQSYSKYTPHLIEVCKVLGGEVNWITVEDYKLQMLGEVEASTHSKLAYSLGARHLRPYTHPGETVMSYYIKRHHIVYLSFL